jgi:hypothetical protein
MAGVMGIDGVETFQGSMRSRTPEEYDTTVIMLRWDKGLNGRCRLVNGVWCSLISAAVMPGVCAECLAPGIATCTYVPDTYAQACHRHICAVVVGDSADRGDGRGVRGGATTRRGLDR